MSQEIIIRKKQQQERVNNGTERSGEAATGGKGAAHAFRRTCAAQLSYSSLAISVPDQAFLGLPGVLIYAGKIKCYLIFS